MNRSASVGAFSPPREKVPEEPAPDVIRGRMRGLSARTLGALATPSAQLFTAPAVSPAMMCRCAAKNTMIVGRMVSVMNARISCQSVMNSPL